MNIISNFQELQAILPDIRSWCLWNPAHCVQLATVLGSMGVPNPASIVLIMKNKPAIVSFLNHMASKDKYRHHFRSFMINKLGLRMQDLQSVKSFQAALTQKILQVCSKARGMNPRGINPSVCKQAQLQLKQLAAFLQPLLKM